ncbi:MurR/RpiR family transcriptional regulator [Roseomonas sp. KE0001]|uniref:MurR/RpiR family transcriptional regulator n=1 Tax=Roseomonas sp. KE0001 TaxID=2479201 RepID=UPI0018DF5D21|nr:MurR/RpiR family transcriptional regulator [Roseomonas sp. KE0001]MBI0434413.1 MurR/RpiR family transcriptional regulator [Roseomonas sp. KE0001]
MRETSPIDLLRQALPGLPPRLQAAGRYVAQHDFDAATRSMRDLAAAAGAPPATFTRLAQALGYTGWEALREALIEARRGAGGAPYSARARRNPGGDLPAAMLAADAEALARLDPAPVAAAARALHEAPRIWIAGFRSCRGVAQLLHYQLRLFRPDSVRLIGGAGPEDLDLGALRPGDAAVLISFAPYSRAIVLAARAAREGGCTTIALADRPHAAMAEGAAHLLRFDAATSPGFFPSLTGALALAQALAAACFALGGEASLVRLRETEARLAAIAAYTPEQDLPS